MQQVVADELSIKSQPELGLLVETSRLLKKSSSRAKILSTSALDRTREPNCWIGERNIFQSETLSIPAII